MVIVRALREHNITVDENNIIRCDTREDAAIIVPRLLNRPEKPDGIFAVNDLTAAAAMKIINDMGYCIPDDIAVVGFTSGLISDITNPTLTSVEQHGYLIGKEAVRLLIERIEKKHDLPSQTKIIKTELVIKGSTLRRSPCQLIFRKLLKMNSLLKILSFYYWNSLPTFN